MGFSTAKSCGATTKRRGVVARNSPRVSASQFVAPILRYMPSKGEPSAVEIPNSERDGEDEGPAGDGRPRCIACSGYRPSTRHRVPPVNVFGFAGESTRRPYSAVTSRHRPQTAGNASSCGTGDPRTIRRAHLTKRTAREVVATATMTRTRLRTSRSQTARPRPALKKSPKPRQAWAWRDQLKGWRRRRLSEQLTAFISVKSATTRNATWTLRCPPRARTPEDCTHQNDVEATA